MRTTNTACEIDTIAGQPMPALLSSWLWEHAPYEHNRCEHEPRRGGIDGVIA
jgi:hypothetical protein